MAPLCMNCPHTEDSHRIVFGGICVGCPCPGFEPAPEAQPEHANEMQWADGTPKMATNMACPEPQPAEPDELETLRKRIRFEDDQTPLPCGCPTFYLYMHTQHRTVFCGQCGVAYERNSEYAALLRSQQQCVAALKTALDLISEEKGWGTYQRMEDSSFFAEADEVRIKLAAALAEAEKLEGK